MNHEPGNRGREALIGDLAMRVNRRAPCAVNRPRESLRDATQFPETRRHRTRPVKTLKTPSSLCELHQNSRLGRGESRCVSELGRLHGSTGKSKDPLLSRSIHLLLGNRSAHAVEAYRKSGAKLGVQTTRSTPARQRHTAWRPLYCYGMAVPIPYIKASYMGLDASHTRARARRHTQPVATRTSSVRRRSTLSRVKSKDSKAEES